MDRDREQSNQKMAQSWWYILLTIITCFAFFPLGIVMLLTIFFSFDTTEEKRQKDLQKKGLLPPPFPSDEWPPKPK